MKDINLLSLDLELNQPSGSIIQVGAVIGNLKTGKILEEYSANIFCSEKLDPYIIKLVGIKQEAIDRGLPLITAYIHLSQMHKANDCFRNCITWGGGDSEALRQSLNINKEEFIFGRCWLDVKTVFISHCFANNKHSQSGLAKSLLRLGLNFEGRKHSAVDDARNTFIIYRELLKLFKES
jgi:inhibitor of KinA sporulation pathway (predicted exonuclease)